MADIAMCEGRDCPLKETCFRYTATPSEWKNFYVLEAYKHGTCENIININKL